MKYTITQLQKRSTREGKPFASMTLQDENGQLLDKVSMWQDFPKFEILTVGDVVSGKIMINDQGFKNLKAESADVKTTVDHSQGYRLDRHNGIVQDIRMVKATHHNPENYRAELIKVAQARKNDSIAYFNATNAAISLVAAVQPKHSHDFDRATLQEEISYWRNWFLKEWKKHEISIVQRQNPQLTS